MSNKLVATVGDNCIDQYAAFGKSAVGGNALNVAVHLAKLGWDSNYFGAVGDDFNGERTKDILLENNVNISHLLKLNGKTSITTLDVDTDGERTITFEDFGVCENYFPREIDIEVLALQKHIHIGWQRNSLELRKQLADTGVTFSQDLAVSTEGGNLDIAFDSVGPSLKSAQKRIENLLAQGNRIAVVTCGSLGSMASDGETIEYTGANEIDVVDTTGAGDTFIAGFISAWLKGEALAECLMSGRNCASRTCSHLGGFIQDYEPLEEPTCKQL